MMHLRPPQGSRTDVFIQGLVAIASSYEAQIFWGGSFLNAVGDSRVPASASALSAKGAAMWKPGPAAPECVDFYAPRAATRQN